MTLTLGNPTWLLPATLALLAFALLLAWTYARLPHIPVTTRLACFILKFLGTAALIFFLLDPRLERQIAKPGANHVAILVDRSASLEIPDPTTGRPRSEEIRDLLAPDAPWLTNLAATHTVHRHVFDSRVRAVPDFTTLTFDGHLTSLHQALADLADRTTNLPLSGLILLTDGNATDPTTLAQPQTISHSPFQISNSPPIYPVLLGPDTAPPDLRIVHTTATESAFEDTPVTIEVEIEATGFQTRDVKVQLLDPATRQVLTTEKRRIATDSARLPIRFEIRPKNPGLFTAIARVESTTGVPEATLANNERLIALPRRSDPIRVLYVGGRPNWEHKFLKRALDHDDLVQLVSLIRISDRTPRFAWRDATAATTNPLYQGFEAAEDEAERFDEPVLVRLDTRDAAELRGGFPTAAADLNAYDALILDDLPATFFTRDQQRLIESYVADRGGSLLALGGNESFRRGHFERTPLADLLPVYLDRAQRPPPRGPVRLDLTREGLLAPWTRLLPTAEAESARLAALPPLRVLNDTGDAKPGATTLATATEADGTIHPALIAQSYGQGRVAALTTGDLWRTGMESPAARRDLERTWRQLLRWLVTDVPTRATLTVRPDPAAPDQSTELRATLRDEDFNPKIQPDVPLEITNPDGTTTLRTAQPDPATPATPGTHTLTTTAPGLHRANLEGAPEIAWTLDPEAKEFETLGINRSLLQTLATASQGELLNPADLKTISERLTKNAQTILETQSTPLWHQWPFLLGAIACFAAEWTLRRKKNLP